MIAAFDDQPEKPDDNEGDRYRDESIAAELADHGGGIGADHDQLAVGHVDDAGNAEDDGQTQSCDHQDRDDAEAAQKLGDDRLKHIRACPEGLASFASSRRLWARLPAPPQKVAACAVTSQSSPSGSFRAPGFFTRSSTRLSVKSQDLFG